MSCVTYLPFLHAHCFELNSTLPCPSLLHFNSLPLPSIDPLHASLSSPVRLSLPVSNPTLIYLNSRYIILTHNILYSFHTPTQTHTPFPPPPTHTHTHTHRERLGRRHRRIRLLRLLCGCVTHSLLFRRVSKSSTERERHFGSSVEAKIW
jgi:hypothetical protein